jgi:hypothetical protein
MQLVIDTQDAFGGALCHSLDGSLGTLCQGFEECARLGVLSFSVQ